MVLREGFEPSNLLVLGQTPLPIGLPEHNGGVLGNRTLLVFRRSVYSRGPIPLGRHTTNLSRQLARNERLRHLSSASFQLTTLLAQVHRLKERTSMCSAHTLPRIALPLQYIKMVEDTGFEPVAYRLPVYRSPK